MKDIRLSITTIGRNHNGVLCSLKKEFPISTELFVALGETTLPETIDFRVTEVVTENGVPVEEIIVMDWSNESYC